MLILIICSYKIVKEDLPVQSSEFRYWMWMSSLTPYDIFLRVAITVSACETILICLVCIVKKIYDILSSFFIITMKNLLHFFLLFSFLHYSNFSGDIATINDVIERLRIFIISPKYYLILVIIIPIYYLLLMKKSYNKERLLLTVIIFNLSISMVVFYYERKLCYGYFGEVVGENEIATTNCINKIAYGAHLEPPSAEKESHKRRRYRATNVA